VYSGRIIPHPPDTTNSKSDWPFGHGEHAHLDDVSASERWATAAYAISQHWSIVMPPVTALYGGLGAVMWIGAVAGLYPSLRAARLSPTDALRTV
jgi:ABC-type antimicrobial peptide transport system permease subunit